MIDPMAIRSYLASLSGQGDLGGQGGVTGGPGGVQAMLANLRNQLYGPQALQAAGGTAAARKPAWQQLREAGIGGQGSPAANRAALRQLPGAQGGQPGLDGTEWMPDQMLGLRPVLQSANGGGLMAPTGTAVDPGFVGTNVNPQATMDYWTPERMASAQPIQWGGGTNPNAPPAGRGPMEANILPGVVNEGYPAVTDVGQANPLPGGDTLVAGAVGPALQGAQKPGATVAPGAAAANVGQAVQQAKPTRTAAPPAVNPAVLGTQQFRGPNARRITQARSSIYNNVRNALRKPAGGQ